MEIYRPPLSGVSSRGRTGAVIVEHMNLRQHGYFVAVVDSGSFSRAAKRANVAQPALSEQIAGLEDELGIRLLIRSQRGIEATAVGLMLYGRARSVLRAIDNIRDVLKSDSEPSGAVIIGLPSASGAMLASHIVSAVVQRHPKLRVRIIEAPSRLHRESLRRGDLDLAIIFDDEVLPALERHPLYAQQLFLVDQRDGRRESSELASLADLAGATLQLGNGGTTGSIFTPTAITDIGLLCFDYSGSVTVGSTIDGSGNVEITAGTVTLGGTGLSRLTGKLDRKARRVRGLSCRPPMWRRARRVTCLAATTTHSKTGGRPVNHQRRSNEAV